MLAPFFQRSYGLLRPGGYLGFIVSNAFATREFGKPLIEDFFPSVELQKIVDCSGLRFPGHGTPTWIIFGRNRTPTTDSPIRTVGIVLGGGDLNTSPENSPLWATLQSHQDQPGYSDERIIVADRPRTGMATWPWNLDVGALATKHLLENVPHESLRRLLIDDIGFMFVMGRNEVFRHSPDVARRIGIRPQYLKPLNIGEEIRDWTVRGEDYSLFPYDQETMQLADFKSQDPEMRLLTLFENELSDRPTFSGSFADVGRTFYQYHQLPIERAKRNRRIVYSFIATHNHCVYTSNPLATSQTARDQSVFLIDLPLQTNDNSYHALAGILNTSSVLFLLKCVCYNKGAGDEEEADRFEYSGTKVEQLSVPSILLASSPPNERLTALSRACWERGQQLPGLAFKKLFEMKGEAYFEWNSSLGGWVKPHSALTPGPSPDAQTARVGRGVTFRTAGELIALRDIAIAERGRLRSEMIALQEEMDWLVYAAYGLLPQDHPAAAVEQSPEPLALGERAFELLRDGQPIPAYFSAERRALWQARLKAIGESEHIRRIEQPVYKRRWYRKESDEREFRRAFEWWLLEKAEWWLEHKGKGGPAALEQWASELWKDERVRAAAAVISPLLLGEGPGVRSGGEAFLKLFKSIVVETTVPDWIPPAMPWEQVEKKFNKQVPARARKIRGKFNVPRERFRVNDKGEYVWAVEME